MSYQLEETWRKRATDARRRHRDVPRRGAAARASGAAISRSRRGRDRVRAAGVVNWDEIVRTGAGDVGRRPPLVLGVEAAGVVVAVGEEVTSLAPGDEVLTHPLPLRHQGTWTERLVAPAVLVARKRGSAGFERRIRARARRRWCKGRTRSCNSRPCAGQPFLRQQAQRVRRASAATVRLRSSTITTPGWPARVREASHGGRGVGAAVNNRPRRGGSCDRGRRGRRASRDDHRRPAPTRTRSHGRRRLRPRRRRTAWPCWSRHSLTEWSHSTSAQRFRSPRRRPHFKPPPPAALRAQPCSRSHTAPKRRLRTTSRVVPTRGEGYAATIGATSGLLLLHAFGSGAGD
jgi:hypothetical protein